MKFARFCCVDRNRRTFPRVPLTEPGLLEFTPGCADSQLSSRGKRRITVMISSVACEGLRLSRTEPIDDLTPGTRINIRLHVDAQEVALPGQVAWKVTANNGETHVGVSLWLEAASASDRHIWARWIVDRTEQADAKKRSAGSGHSVAEVAPSAVRRAVTNQAS